MLTESGELNPEYLEQTMRMVVATSLSMHGQGGRGIRSAAQRRSIENYGRQVARTMKGKQRDVFHQTLKWLKSGSQFGNKSMIDEAAEIERQYKP